jgi:NAD(P)-dependent dehydrogenase (short-subunit alcohol dehydrogenase family)
MVTLKELMSLKKRTALITGAAGGLGKVMAQTLAEQGADLVLIDRPGTDLQGIAESMRRDWQVNAEYQECDLELQEQRDELIHWMSRSTAGLSILINNAAFVGTSELQGWAVPFEEQTVETWRRTMEVNLTAVFHLCQGLMPLMKSSEGASIINIGSIYGEYGPDWSLYEGLNMSNPAAYAASKGGLIQLTRWLSTTMAPHIRVNAISPGGVHRNQPEKFVERYAKRTPLARMATEDDFRGTIAFLGSDLSQYITGQNIAVDGGWGVW